MSDNTTINPGTAGDSIATDDIGGIKYQRVKLIHGADGVNDGDVSTANGFPVQVVTGVAPGTGATSLGKAEDAAHASGDVGVMALAVRKETTANLSGTDADYEPLQVFNGRVQVAQRCATATLSNVNDSASSVSLLASNTSRLGATFYNDSTTTLYLKLGTTASTTSYTVQLPPNGYYELPMPVYTGAIDGIWSADASGAVRITELS